MRNIKHLLKTLPLALAVLLLTACGSRTPELRLRVTAPEGSAWSDAVTVFQERIDALSEGAFRVRVYYDSPSGDNLVEPGELGLHAFTEWQGQAEVLSVVSLPWLFDGYDDVDANLLSGAGKDAVFDLLRAQGVEPLALGENGFRQLTNDIRSINSPGDLRELTFRVPVGSVMFSAFRALGADSRPLEWRDTLDALADGSVSGQENSLDAIRGGQFYKVQRYLTLWNCSYDPVCFAAGTELWEKLTEEQREMVRTAAEEACAAQVAASRAREEGTLSEIAASGVEVARLDADEIAAFRDAAAPLRAEWRTRAGNELFAALGRGAE